MSVDLMRGLAIANQLLSRAIEDPDYRLDNEIDEEDLIYMNIACEYLSVLIKNTSYEYRNVKNNQVYDDFKKKIDNLLRMHERGSFLEVSIENVHEMFTGVSTEIFRNYVSSKNLMCKFEEDRGTYKVWKE